MLALVRPRNLALVLLVLLGINMQMLTARLAVVPSLDAVHFVEIAQNMHHYGAVPALRHFDQQPLFPLWLWMFSGAAEGLWQSSGTDLPPDFWCVCVQAAAAIPLILCVFPLYGIWQRRVGDSTAWLTCLFFLVLPSFARIGADGLADSLHLLCFLMGVWTWTRTEESSLGYFATGGWLALACQTRLEAALAVPVWMAVVWCSQQPRVVRSKQIAGLCLGWMLVTLPFVLVIGKLTPKYNLASFSASASVLETETKLPWAAVESVQGRLPDGSAWNFDYKEHSTTTRRYGPLAALQQFLAELPQAWGYVGLLLLLPGMWRMTGFRSFDAFVWGYGLFLSLVAIAYAAKTGYLSQRHLLTGVVLLLGYAAFGLEQCVRWLKAYSLPDAKATYRPLLVAACFALILVPWMFRSLQPLHDSRAGHRAAGEWLAKVSAPSSLVLDTRQVTGLFSGCRTVGYDRVHQALRDEQLSFVVVEEAELGFESQRSRTLRYLLERHGELAARFDACPQKTICVYQWKRAPVALAQNTEQGTQP